MRSAGTVCSLFAGGDTFLGDKRHCVDESRSVITPRNLLCTSTRTKKGTAPACSSVTGVDGNRHAQCWVTRAIASKLVFCGYNADVMR
jgi:hypothetical protein